MQSTVLILQISRNRHDFASAHDPGISLAIHHLLQGQRIVGLDIKRTFDVESAEYRPSSVKANVFWRHDLLVRKIEHGVDRSWSDDMNFVIIEFCDVSQPVANIWQIVLKIVKFRYIGYYRSHIDRF